MELHPCHPTDDNVISVANVFCECPSHRREERTESKTWICGSQQGLGLRTLVPAPYPYLQHKWQAASKKCVEHCGNLTLMREVSWRPIHAKIMVMAVSISWATQAASVEENSVSNQEAGSSPSFSTQPSCQSWVCS